MFKQPHQERGFSRAKGAAEDVKGDWARGHWLTCEE
jgi:hypothetical protein